MSRKIGLNNDQPQYAINTQYQWHGDDIFDVLRGMIRSQLGGYLSDNAKYLLAAKPKNTYILVTPPISTFEKNISFDYYLDKSKQPDAQSTDVFDELMPEMMNNQKASAKILFSFNISNLHWTTCVIKIKKTNNQHTVYIYSHDTYGGGTIPKKVFNCLSETIKKRITNFHPSYKVKCSSKISRKTARQHHEDGASCGIISTQDIIRVIRGESIDLPSTYTPGATELRKEFLDQLSGMDLTETIKDRIRTNNTRSSLALNKKPNNKKQLNPTFMLIEEQSSTSYSSSDDSSSENFDDTYFKDLKDPPFCIKKSPGTVNPDSIDESSSCEESNSVQPMSTSDTYKTGYVLTIPSYANGEKNELISKINSVLLPEAFQSTAEESLPEAKQRLRINIGFNRMKSISKKKNRALEKTVDSAKNQIEDHRTKVFGFFWTPKWFDKIKKRQTSIKRVRAWYKKIKKKNPTAAKILVDELENRILPEMIPYTQIRERIKNHPKTKSFIKQLRANDDINHIYLTSFDDDFVSLRLAQIGLFSEYDRLVTEHESTYDEPPQVLTTGYLVSSMHMPIIEIAVKLDMVVRQATSAIFKNAVYYNEPNTIIYVNPEHDTVEASFISTGKSCKNEMPNLMADLIKKRSLNPDECFVFYSSNAPLVTKMPIRMQAVSKKAKRKVFTGQKSKDGKILRFNYHDLQMLIKTSQSHAISREWANRVLNSLPIPEKVIVDTLEISNHDVSYALQSLVARLFTYFNPVYAAQDQFSSGQLLRNKVNNYIYHLEDVCSKYPQSLKLKKAKPGKDREKLTNKNIISFRKQLDDITNIDTLISYIGKLLNSNDLANKIKLAAKASGTAIRDELMRSLSFDFPRMIYASLTDLLNELNDDDCDEYDELGDNTKSVLESLADNSFVDKNSHEESIKLIKSEFEHGLNLLHLAVLSGNKQAIKFLLEKGFSLETATTNLGLLPLHLAILYCANYGNDLELIHLCLTKKAVLQPLRNHLTPLMMAIMMLDDPLPVISVLCQHGALDENLHDSLYEVLHNAVGRELRTPLLACIHYQPMNTDLAKAMISNGADVNQRGIIESKTYDQDPERQFTYPLCESITSENIELLYHLLKNNAQTTDIYDSEGRPPLIIAIHDTSHPTFFVKLLLRYKADLAECDLIEGTYPLHESISPLHSRYLAPGPNKQKYQDAFMQALRNIGQHPPRETDLFRYLLSKASPDILELQDGNGDTPLRVALEIENDEIIDLLLDAGADTEDLEREECEYIRKNTTHEIYHSEEREEQADQEMMDMAEEAIESDGIDLDTSNSEEIINALISLINHGIPDPEEVIFRLYDRPKSDDEGEEEDSSEDSSSSYKMIFENLSADPLDFKYEDEENLDEEEIDYPDDPPNSNPQSSEEANYDSYEGSGYSSGN